eukprot:5716162-Amphidinium_carterae.1
MIVVYVELWPHLFSPRFIYLGVLIRFGDLNDSGVCGAWPPLFSPRSRNICGRNVVTACR